MDKNFITAIILSIVVLVVFQTFIFKKPQKGAEQGIEQQSSEQSTSRSADPTTEPNPAQVGDSEKQREAARADRAEGISEPTSLMIEQLPEKEIVVESENFRATLTSHGMKFTSFKLKKYRIHLDPDSPPVDLVPPGAAIFGQSISGVYINVPSDIPFHCADEAVDLRAADETYSLACSATAGGYRIDKIFKFEPDSYLLDLTVKVSNLSGRLTDISVRFENELIVDSAKTDRYNFTGPAIRVNGKEEIVEVSDIESERYFSGNIDWAAMEEKYFVTAILPGKEIPVYEYRLTKKATAVEEVVRTISTLTTSGEEAIPLPPGSDKEIHVGLYLGPKKVEPLKAAGAELERVVDYGFFEVIARPMLRLLKIFTSWTGNWGVSIIILTFLIKVLFFPLSQKSMVSMRKMQVKMQAFQPELKEVQEKYKDDRSKLNQVTMELYKKHGINPASQLAGCLPMLIQIPIFIALYYTLLNSIELRHTPFFLYINDLSAPEVLYSIPIFGGLPIRPMPLVMGALMFLQQRMTPQTGDATMRSMMYFMPIFMTFIFYNFPSGLVLYWLINNLLSIGQQYLVNRATPS